MIKALETTTFTMTTMLQSLTKLTIRTIALLGIKIMIFTTRKAWITFNTGPTMRSIQNGALFSEFVRHNRSTGRCVSNCLLAPLFVPVTTLMLSYFLYLTTNTTNAAILLWGRTMFLSPRLSKATLTKRARICMIKA